MENKQNKIISIILLIIVICLLMIGYFLYEINKRLIFLEDESFFSYQTCARFEREEKNFLETTERIKEIDRDIEIIKEDMREAEINFSEQRIQRYYKQYLKNKK